MKKDIFLILPLAFFFAVLMLLPHLFFTQGLGGGFKSIYYFVDDDASYYVARVQDVLDGHPLLGNPYLAEHKASSPMQFFFPDWVAAAPLKLLGVSAPPGVLWSTLLWVPLLITLFFVALRLLTDSRAWAYIATVLLFCGPLLRYWNRPVSPQTTMPFWLILLIVLIFFLKKLDEESAPGRMPKKFLALLVLAFGVLFYVYPYGWTFYTVLLGFLTLASWAGFLKIPARFFFAVLGGGFAIGMPYFLMLMKASRLPEYGESLTRLGMISTHFPSGINIVVPSIVFIAAYLLCLRQGWIPLNARTIMVVCGFLALIIIVNQHLITGKNLEFSSHYIDTMRLWTAIGLAYGAAEIEKRTGKKKLLFCAAAIVLIGYALPSAYRIVKTTSANAAYIASDQRYRPVFDELRTRTIKDDVVLADEKLSLLIPMYTSDNVYSERHGNLFFISDQEVFDRFLLAHYFDDVNEKFLRDHERALWGVRYIDQAGHVTQKNKLRKLLGFKPLPVPGIPADEIEKALRRFQELKGDSYENELKQYRVDWIVWDTQRYPGWNGLEHLPFLEKVSDIEENFVVYRVK